MKFSLGENFIDKHQYQIPLQPPNPTLIRSRSQLQLSNNDRDRIRVGFGGCNGI